MRDYSKSKNDSSSGHDDVPLWYVKTVARIITFPLAHIINSFMTEVVII